MGLLCCGALISACTEGNTPIASSSRDGAPGYVGSASCQACHAEQYTAWQGSHHRMAMQPPTTETVVGDFSGTSFGYAGIVYEFYIRDGTYRVRADDQSGDMQDFDIKYTFGVEPLQQYLVEFPDGRIQALSVAWDARARDDGGQRWFHLYPDDGITYDDELHWTWRNQNWNFMCADCHTTDFRKNYSIDANRYESQFAEVTVGCEACHGPGSEHVATAGRDTQVQHGFDDAVSTQSGQLEVCARCHARRGQIAERFRPGDALLDHYRPALLEEGLYHADGQVLEEVYVYGSFLQSKMHQRGVVCSDCHDPHAAKLIVDGNALCTACHRQAPPARFPTLNAGDYDQPAHHFHEPGTEGARCVSCHMPDKLYMVVDARRDHSFRIPRPDMSESTGAPNACNGCHVDRGPAWAAAEIARRFPGDKPLHFGASISAGRRRDPEALPDLVELARNVAAPAIVRATALSLLQGFDGPDIIGALEAGLADDEPLVRLGAIEGIGQLAIPQRWALARDRLDDEVLAVRNEAAFVLAPMLGQDMRQAERATLQAALDDYARTLTLNGDRPEALTTLGGIHAMAGNDAGAELALTRALALDPEWLPALVNLADLYRSTGRDAEARNLLSRAVVVAPGNAAVRYAQGLLLVRSGRLDDAITEIRRAAELDPAEPRYRYAYGIALNSAGRSEDAIRELESGLRDFPANAQMLYALATMERDRGNTERALSYAEQLLQSEPRFPGALQLQQQLQSIQAN